MRALLVLFFVLVAGCASVSDVLAPSEGLAFEAPVPVSLTAPGAEPVIAVAPDGTAYVEGIGNDGDGNVNKVFRSADGTTWADITPPAFGEERSNDGFVAVSTDGTLYASNVFSLTFQLFRSEDQGATWSKLHIPPVPALMHRHWIVALGDTLHVTIEALPPSFAPYLAGAPLLPGQATDSQSGMWYTTSADAGDTWSAPTQIDPIVNFAGQTNMVVSDDGKRLYVARYQEDAPAPEYTYDDGHWYLLASEDGGATWERREMFDLTSELSTAVPGLALAADGSLWMAWTQEARGNSTLYIASSPDGGRSWGDAWTPAGLDGTRAMAFVAAAPDGRLGLMWYQADVPGTASQVDAPWSVHYAEITQGNVTGTLRVTPAPVHEGNICAKGPACEEGEDRTLLDYPWIDFGPDGAAWLVFPSTKWDRPSAFAVVARESR